MSIDREELARIAGRAYRWDLVGLILTAAHVRVVRVLTDDISYPSGTGSTLRLDVEHLEVTRWSLDGVTVWCLDRTWIEADGAMAPWAEVLLTEHDLSDPGLRRMIILVADKIADPVVRTTLLATCPGTYLPRWGRWEL